MLNMPTGGELLILVLVALIVLGPDRIPEVARNLGRLINRLKTMSEGFQSTVNNIADDDSMKPIKDLGELAARPRQKLAEFAAEAEAEDRARRQADERARIEAEQAAADALRAEAEDQGDIGAPAERPTGSVQTDDETDETSGSTVHGHQSGTIQADDPRQAEQ